MEISDNYRSDEAIQELIQPNAYLNIVTVIEGAFRSERLDTQTRSVLEDFFHEKIAERIELIFNATILLKEILFSKELPCQFSLDLRRGRFSPGEEKKAIKSIEDGSLKKELETQMEGQALASDPYLQEKNLIVTVVWTNDYTKAMRNEFSYAIRNGLRKLSRQ